MKHDSSRDIKKALYAIGLNFLSINAILQIYQSLIPLIMQRDFYVSELTIGMVTGTANIIVCLMLLILNKMKPSLKTLISSSLILSIALAITPFSMKQNSIILFVILFCTGMMALSLTKVLANDFTLQVSPAGKENSSMALTKIMSTLGGLVALIVMFLFSDNNVFYAMVLLNTLTVGYLFYVRKNIHTKHVNYSKPKSCPKNTGLIGKRGIILLIILLCYTVYDAMLGTFSRYAKNVWNMENNDFAIYQSICLIAAFIAYIPIGKWANEKNQKKLTLIGFITMAIGLISMTLFPSFHYVTIIFFVLIGVGWAAIAVNIVPILVYGTMPEEVSRLVGYYSVMSNISLILAPTISGFILEYSSYQILYYLLAGLLVIATIVLSFFKVENQ